MIKPLKKKRYSSRLNYRHEDQIFERFTEPSKTIPDQSLTIDEILKRYASGRPVNVKIYDEFTGDDDLQTGVDIRTLDLHEVHEMLQQSRANVEKLQTEQRLRIQAKRDADLEASIIKKYEERRKQNPPEEKPKFVQLTIPGADDKKPNQGT